MTREDHAHYPATRVPPERFNERQPAAMGPLGRRLLGVDAWT